MSIGQKIFEQLGGRRFRIMTGAKDLLSTASGLRFKLPARLAKEGINFIQIELTPDDLYNVRFSRARGNSAKELSRFTGVSCDMLIPLFEQETGLCTRL